MSDTGAVERAARAIMAEAGCDVHTEDADCPHVDDSMPCRCETRFALCVEHDGEDPQRAGATVCPWAERMARAALAAAAPTVEQVLAAHAWIRPVNDSARCACGWQQWGVRADLRAERYAAHMAEQVAALWGAR